MVGRGPREWSLTIELSQLANLGEFIGGVAVLATLIYLTGQVRISKLAEQAQTHRALVEVWNAAFVEPLRDPTVSPPRDQGSSASMKNLRSGL